MFQFRFCTLLDRADTSCYEDKTKWIEPLGSPVDGGSWDLSNVSTFLPDCTTSQNTTIFVAIVLRSLVSQIVNSPINAATLPDELLEF